MSSEKGFSALPRGELCLSLTRETEAQGRQDLVPGDLPLKRGAPKADRYQGPLCGLYPTPLWTCHPQTVPFAPLTCTPYLGLTKLPVLLKAPGILFLGGNPNKPLTLVPWPWHLWNKSGNRPG